MKVEISKTFEVNAPPNDVWNFMTDVKKVSTCIPGAEYLEDLGDNKHSVLIVVKVGPIKSKYRGEVYLKNIDNMITKKSTKAEDSIKNLNK